MKKKYFLNNYFKLDKHETTVKRELWAGLTTFITMAYIIFVNPNILADTGMPKEAAFVATIYSTVLTTLLMGLWANLPVAVAPAMGVNAFFAYYVCGVVGLHWTVALGATFISGIVFLILSLTHIRSMIIDAVPLNLKYAIVVGIGLFITLIGLKSAGIVVGSPSTLVTLADLKTPQVTLSCFGLLLSSILIARKVQGALLYGIVATTILSMILDLSPTPASLTQLFSFSIPDISPVFMKLDIMGALKYGIISIILTFTLVELFNNMGSLIALLSKANRMDKDGKIDDINKALTTDSIGVILSAGLGTSSVASYVESATGITAGGRTGLTAVMVAFLFLIMLIFAPLVELVPIYATAPSLIIVGLLMSTDMTRIRFNDITEALPAFLMMIMMSLSYSISNGFIFGFISYAVLKLFTGRAKEVNAVMWIIALFFLINICIS